MDVDLKSNHTDISESKAYFISYENMSTPQGFEFKKKLGDYAQAHKDDLEIYKSNHDEKEGWVIICKTKAKEVFEVLQRLIQTFVQWLIYEFKDLTAIPPHTSTT